MFTGIIEDVGTIVSTARVGNGRRVSVTTHLANDGGIKLGDSVSVEGCCLTAAKVDGTGFEADLSAETIARTTLGSLQATSLVNLERAVSPAGRLGGHIVQGHVDGGGSLESIRADGDSRILTFVADAPILPFLVEKGSVAVNGVSLTVNRVTEDGFTVTLIAHTVLHTTLRSLKKGSAVNLEADVVAKYVVRGLEAMFGKKFPGGLLQARKEQDLV